GGITAVPIYPAVPVLGHADLSRTDRPLVGRAHGVDLLVLVRPSIDQPAGERTAQLPAALSEFRHQGGLDEYVPAAGRPGVLYDQRNGQPAHRRRSPAYDDGGIQLGRLQRAPDVRIFVEI